jgi:hypothetical protein
MRKESPTRALQVSGMMAEPKKYRCVAGHIFPGSKPGVVPKTCPLCGAKVAGNIRGSIGTK